MNIPNRTPVPAVVPGMPAAMPPWLAVSMNQGQVASRAMPNGVAGAGLAGQTIGCLSCAQPGLKGPSLADAAGGWPLWAKLGLAFGLAAAAIGGIYWAR